jgi:hypothetical protein
MKEKGKGIVEQDKEDDLRATVIRVIVVGIAVILVIVLYLYLKR